MNDNIYVNFTVSKKYYKCVIEASVSGVDLLVYDTENSLYPEWDYYLDDINSAKELALERFGADMDAWSILGSG